MSPSNFSRKKNTSSRTIALSIGVIFLIIGAIIFAVRQIGSTVPAVYGDKANLSLLSRRALINKAASLQATADGYDAQLQELALLRGENEKFKAELGRGDIDRGMLAHVITEQNRSFYDTFVIDGGSEEGIIEGQTVFAFGSIAVGTIARTSDHTSVVSLFSAPGRETAGTAQGSDVAVTLIGRGNGEYELRMPRDVHFEVGSTIAFQSTQTAVLANVERAVGDPRDPFQRFLAKAPVNIQALKWVMVR